MRVSDADVGLVRAFLVDQDEFERRVGRMQDSDDLDGYRAILAATMFHLVQGVFGQSADAAADVVRWVARTRARLAEESFEPELDPAAAEQLIVTHLGMSSTYADFDEETRLVTQSIVLESLYSQPGLDTDELDQLLTRARQDGDTALEQVANSQG